MAKYTKECDRVGCKDTLETSEAAYARGLGRYCSQKCRLIVMRRKKETRHTFSIPSKPLEQDEVFDSILADEEVKYLGEIEHEDDPLDKDDYAELNFD